MVLRIIQEFQFPPLHEPLHWGTHVVGGLWAARRGLPTPAAYDANWRMMLHVKLNRSSSNSTTKANNIRGITSQNIQNKRSHADPTTMNMQV